MPRPVRTAAFASLLLSLALLGAFLARVAPVGAQGTPPSVVDPNLGVRVVVSGLVQPTTMAFLGPSHFLVLEKASGRVLRVLDGMIQDTVLDLPVNSASERGLLGIALHPNFPGNPGVYLYWTESSTGADSGALANVALLGNRVDRFVWNGTTLTHETNIIRLRAFQSDAGQPLRGNHNGGMVKFGPDGKLYIFIGDEGRRGWMQNLPCGAIRSCGAPFTFGASGFPDDQFGGPEPDDAHLTGVILRLNDDGSTPPDNPLFAAGANIGGDAGENLQKVFAYGLRNSFGMDFDPIAGSLWLEQNGDDSFTEIDRVFPGMNGGWVQVMGPLSRIAQFKAIETSPEFLGLQQDRWSPFALANTAEEAEARFFKPLGSTYSDPEFSWKYEVAPAGLGFQAGNALGAEYNGNLFVGGARDLLVGGHLFRLKLSANRQEIVSDDPRLADRVADNLAKFDITESETLLFGRDFGVGTDVRSGPNGNLFVVSLSKGAIYEIFRK
jgi:glucose/arabinose dehydrogenase